MGEGVVATAATISSVMTSLGDVATDVLGYCKDVAQVAVQEPLFAIPLGCWVLFTGATLMSKILHK